MFRKKAHVVRYNGIFRLTVRLAGTILRPVSAALRSRRGDLTPRSLRRVTKR